MFLFSTLLFFILTPGILLTIPKKSSKTTVALVHALVFATVWSLTYKCFWYVTEGFDPTIPPSIDPDSKIKYDPSVPPSNPVVNNNSSTNIPMSQQNMSQQNMLQPPQQNMSQQNMLQPPQQNMLQPPQKNMLQPPQKKPAQQPQNMPLQNIPPQNMTQPPQPPQKKMPQQIMIPANPALISAANDLSVNFANFAKALSTPY